MASVSFGLEVGRSNVFSGLGTISNTTTGATIKKDGTPASARFFVIDRITRRVVYAGSSNSDGSWQVDGLATDRYFQIITINTNDTLNSATLDWVQPQVI